MVHIRKKTMLLLCALLLAACPVFAQAITVDYSRSGNIVVHLEVAPAQKISDVNFALYRVGDVDNAYGGVNYRVNDVYAGSGVTLDYQTSGEALANAEKLKRYIADNGLPAQTTALTDGNGAARFAALEVGVYFLEAVNGGPEGLAVSPLILSAPYFTATEGDSGGTLDYSVEVYPKAEAVPMPTPTSTSAPTPTPTPAVTPSPTPTHTVTNTPTPITTLTPTPYAVTTRPPTNVRYIDGQWVYVDENDVPLGVLPQTGDETSWLLMGLAIVLPLLACGVAIWIVYGTKRRSRKK